MNSEIPALPNEAPKDLSHRKGAEGKQDQDERDTLFQQPQAAPFDEGLGMRLLVARSIAEAHGGELAGVDAPDGSAAVRLYLPLADCDALESL